MPRIPPMQILGRRVLANDIRLSVEPLGVSYQLGDRLPQFGETTGGCECIISHTFLRSARTDPDRALGKSCREPSGPYHQEQGLDHADVLPANLEVAWTGVAIWRIEDESDSIRARVVDGLAR